MFDPGKKVWNVAWSLSTPNARRQGGQTRKKFDMIPRDTAVSVNFQFPPSNGRVGGVVIRLRWRRHFISCRARERGSANTNLVLVCQETPIPNQE